MNRERLLAQLDAVLNLVSSICEELIEEDDAHKCPHDTPVQAAGSRLGRVTWVCHDCGEELPDYNPEDNIGPSMGGGYLSDN